MEFDGAAKSVLAVADGEVLRTDRLAAGHDGRMLDRVTQLSDISGPSSVCAARQSTSLASGRSATFASGACLKKWSARAGMSSRRSRNGGRWIWKTLRRKNRSSRNSPAAISEPRGRLVAAIDPDVGEPRPGVADRRDFPVLDGPQQLDLKARRDVADFVQEHGPAAGELEQPLSVLDRPRERPLYVPEQFALDQAGAECGQADRQERAVAAAAMAMDRPGDQLLAGPALARDQHGHVGRRDQARCS